MKQSRYIEMAKRLATLPLDKQQLFRQKLAEQGINSWSLPIVPFTPQRESSTDAGTQVAVNALRDTPLSLAQQRFIVAEQMSEQSLYNLCSVLRFDQGLNIDVLTTAVQLLAQRHQVLRTTYQQDDKGLWHPHLLDSSPYDVAGSIKSMDINEDDIDAWCQDEYERQLSQAFDLGSASPFRVNLYLSNREDQKSEARKASEQNSYYLFFTIHHIAFDAWSAQQLIQELSMIYGVIHHQKIGNGAQDINVDTVLPALPIQYQDYAAWQKAWLESDDYTSQEQYWKTQLSQFPDILRLPQDRRTKPLHERTYAGAIEVCSLGDELSQQLRTTVNQQGNTLYIYLQTAFSWLLSHYTQQTDFCFGSSVANRDRDELSGLIGPLLNTLVIRHRLDGNPSFADALLQTRNTTAKAFDAKDYPFEHLSKLLDTQRSSALFNIMFVHVALPSQLTIQLPGTQASVINPEQKHARFDLTLRVIESGEGEVRLELEYSTELFDQSTIKQWLLHTVEIIKASIARPAIRLSELSLSGQSSQLTGPALKQPASLLTDRVLHWAQHTPDAVALDTGNGTISHTGESTISYKQWQQSVDAFASQLKTRFSVANQSSKLVGLCLPRGPQQMTVLMACWRLGLVAVMLDPRQPVSRLNSIIDSAALRLVIVDDLIDGLGVRLESGEMVDADSLASLPVSRVPVQETSVQKASVREVLVQVEFKELSTNTNTIKHDFPVIASADSAYIIYTSGSTGTPKGVVVSHGAMSHYAAGISQQLYVESYSLDVSSSHKARWLTLATVAADLGLTSVLAALYQGQTLLLPHAELAFDPPELAAFLRQHPADYLKIVPSHLHGLLSVENPLDILPRHTLVLGGEGLDISLYQRIKEIAPDLRIVNHYGPSETTVGVSAIDLTSNESALFENNLSAVAPLGSPLAGMCLEVRSQNGKLLPRGAIGELYIAGPQLADGYWQSSEQTNAAFNLDDGTRYYRSGDRVRINSAGHVEYLGRLDDQIKRRGYRLELGEISVWLNVQPEIELSIAILTEQKETNKQRLIAFCQFNQDHLSSAGDATKQIISAVQERMRVALPNYMLVDHLFAVQALPLNDNGKIDRQQLSALNVDQLIALDSGQSQGAAAVQSVDDGNFNHHETILSQLWMQLLKVDSVTRDNDFFALGGDSILSLQLIGLARSHGLTLKPLDVITNSRFADMAALFVEPDCAKKTAIIDELIPLFEEILGNTDVSADTDFFQSGGDSILSLQLIARARIADIALSPKMLMQVSSPKAIAEHVLAASLDAQDKPQGASGNGVGNRASEINRIPQLNDEQRQQPQPLSSSQQRIWFMQQFNPQSTAYNVTQLFEVKGVLNFESLSYAVEQLVQKHEILRCRYFEKDGQSWQQLLTTDSLSSPLNVHFPTQNEVVALHDVDREIELSSQGTWQEKIDAAKQRIFDLQTGQVFAIDLVEVTKEHYQLLINLHHIVTDGWSMGLLVQDFLGFYQQHSSEQAAPTSGTKHSYLDWAAYQQTSQDDTQNTLKDYWHQRLEGVAHSITLPIDHSYPAVQTTTGKLHELTLDSGLSDNIDSLAKRHAITPFNVYLAAFNILLWRYSGETDFAVGIPVSGREHVDTQAMVGVFINTLASRQKIEPTQAFSDWLNAVAQRTNEDLAHQAMPLETLLDELKLERNLSRPALFQTLFNYQSDQKQQRVLRLPNLDLTPVSLGERAAKYEISMNVFRQDAVSLQLEYNSDLFESSTIDRILGDYQSLLTQLCKHSDNGLDTFVLPSMVHVNAKGAATAIDQYDDFISRFETRVQQQPDALALIADDQNLSYEELNRQANQLAHWLIAQGVGPEQLVAFCLPRDSRLLVTLLAIQKAGAAYLPLDPSHPAQRLRYIVEHARASLCLCDGAIIEQLSPTLSDVPISQKGNKTMQLVDIAMAQSGDFNNPAPKVWPNNLAYVLYTSGSTGAPKGVQLERGQFANFLRAMEHIIPPFSKVLGLTTITFDIAGLELCLPLVTGAAVVLANEEARRDDQLLAALIKNHAVDLIQATPASWRLLQHIPHELLQNVTALAGGEALDSELATLLNERCGKLINVYGPTETTVWSSSYTYPSAKLDNDSDLAPENRLASVTGMVPIGQPILNNQCYVLDEQLQPVPVGVIGELYIGGHGVARGYQYQAALTAERFLPNPFIDNVISDNDMRDKAQSERLYRTGDQVKWLASGELYFVGRSDHQVKLRGLRIELGEIDATLLSHPAISHAAITLQGEHLVAYYVPQSEFAIDREALEQHLATTLPDYMLPQTYRCIDVMPLNSNGKVDRNALAQLTFNELSGKGGALNERETKNNSIARALTEPEQMIAEIWRTVLGVSTVNADDDFFLLGGHSLMAVQVRVRLEEKGFVLPLKTLFEYPVLSALGKIVSSASHQGLSMIKIPQATRQAMMPLSNAQQRIWFMQQLKPADTSFNMSSVIELQGKLDLRALQMAVDAVVYKHEILRVTYHDQQGEGVQQVHDELRVTVQVISLPKSDDDFSERSEHALQQSANSQFKLGSESPLKVFVYQTAAERYLCQLVQHHIASDGWSTALLMNDLTTAYEQAISVAPNQKVNLTPLTLTPLAIQYVDYAHWQQQQRDQQKIGIEYWRTALSGMPDQLALPFKKDSRSSVNSGHGDAVDFSLSAELTGQLKQLAKEQQCSLFMVLMAAFSAQLHHHTRSQDITIGTDAANRPQAETEALIGFFVNLVAVRTKPKSTQQFNDYLQQVKLSCLDSFEHQGVPFDQVVDAVKPPRIDGVHPLIQALLVMQNTPNAKPYMGDIKVTPQVTKQQHSKFDMALFVSELEDTLSMRWVFRTQLFDRSSIEFLSQDLQRLLHQIVEQVDAPLTALASKDKGNTMTEQTTSSTNEASPSKPAKRKMNKLSKLGKMNKIRKTQSDSTATTTGSQTTVSPTVKSLVRVTPIKEGTEHGGKAFPLLVECLEPGLDPFAWAKTNQDQIVEWLEAHAGILFRGFNLPTPVEFEGFCQSMYPDLYGQYGDLPKKEEGKKIYKSTPYPNDHMIMFHNESSHQYRWPRRQWFYCEIPSAVGGATPIVDCRAMFAKLPEAVREKLQRKQLRYTRNFSGLDVSWQHFFKTEDRTEVERICTTGNISFEWVGEDGLRISETCPAIIRHPITGDMSFFNQIQLHHYSFLEDSVRDHLLTVGGEEGMPRNVYYGDGEPLEQSVVDLISELYEECAVRFTWQHGDVAMLDNMLAAHARDPFEGERKMVVAMGDLYHREQIESDIQKASTDLRKESA